MFLQPVSNLLGIDMKLLLPGLLSKTHTSGNQPGLGSLCCNDVIPLSQVRERSFKYWQHTVSSLFYRPLIKHVQGPEKADIFLAGSFKEMDNWTVFSVGLSHLDIIPGKSLAYWYIILYIHLCDGLGKEKERGRVAFVKINTSTLACIHAKYRKFCIYFSYW